MFISYLFFLIKINNSLNIVYFLTYGYSLETWNESSALEREAKYFNFLSDAFGFKFYIVTYGDETDLAYENIFSNAEIIPVYKYKKYFNSKVINLINSLTIPSRVKKLISENIDITKQNQLLGTWVSYIFKKKTGSKFFIRTGYDMFLFSKYEKKSYVKQRLYLFLTLFGLRYSDIYTVSSETDFEYFHKQLRFKNKNKLKILRNWVDTKGYLNDSQRKEAFVSVGRLEYQKNYEFLINEISDLETPLIIYGKGSNKDKLIHLANQLDVNFQIVDNISNEELISQLRNTKYFILTSYYEGNPKALLEAMSVGCIVIASNIKNHSEIIAHGLNGYLFDIEEGCLNKQLKEILSESKLNSEELELISQNASKKIDMNFSISKIANDEHALILELINAR